MQRLSFLRSINQLLNNTINNFPDSQTISNRSLPYLLAYKFNFSVQQKSTRTSFTVNINDANYKYLKAEVITATIRYKNLYIKHQAILSVFDIIANR